MTLAVAYSRAVSGMDAPLVTVETHMSVGFNGFYLVGLPEAAVKESRERVMSAFENSNLQFPFHKLTINLAPADLPKQSGRYDLAIALSILAVSGQLDPAALRQYEFAGELALTGGLRPISGCLPMAIHCRKANRSLCLPDENASEAALCEGLNVLPANSLLEVCAHLLERNPIESFVPSHSQLKNFHYPDMADVKGQEHAKRAIEVSAAGAHSLLLQGPPGTGKTMLASRLPGLLPPMTEHEAIETTAVYSISHKPRSREQFRQRPFRAPHHTASSVALVGGGSHPKPGEISLAHNGVLFLDELPEFSRAVLEVLREPIEAGKIAISRANQQVEFPAKFQLISAMNPCPCGYFGDEQHHCRCAPGQVQLYQNRISGPLLERIDMFITMPRISHRLLSTSEPKTSESSEVIRQRVSLARERQNKRQQKVNSHLSSKEVEKYCRLNTKDLDYFVSALERLACAPRAYHRILRVARTIADLEAKPNIERSHLSEALHFRHRNP